MVWPPVCLPVRPPVWLPMGNIGPFLGRTQHSILANNKQHELAQLSAGAMLPQRAGRRRGRGTQTGRPFEAAFWAFWVPSKQAEEERNWTRSCREEPREEAWAVE